MTNDRAGRPVRDGVAAALQGTLQEGRKMAQHNLSPTDRARIAINEAAAERDRLLALLIVLIQKMGNDVVITHAEMQDIDPNLQLQQTNPTEIGFKLTTERIAPS